MTTDIAISVLVWGAGEMGRRVLLHLGEEHVIAFIDSNEDKIGRTYYGKQIISLNEYKKRYYGRFILIATLEEQSIENSLQREGIECYFRLSDCPSEFSEVEERGVLKKFVLNRVMGHSKVAIYGSSYYALILNEWISTYNDIMLKVIIPRYNTKNYTHLLMKNYKGINFEKEEDGSLIEETDYLVLNCMPLDEEKGVAFRNRNVVNVFDITAYEGSYYNPIIERFRNLHQGEDCFIIGHGPSLRSDDLDTLNNKGMITFSMNQIYHILDKTDWRPDYYVACDKNIFDRRSYFKWEHYTKRECFIADISESFWKDNNSEKNIKYHSIRNMPQGKVEFSEDISRKVCYGATVTYDCMQIAAYMGFSRIFLLGMDLCPYDNRDKSRGVEYENYFSQDEGKGAPRFWLDRIIAAYEAARLYAEKKGFHFYNVTRGGYLEVFDRVNFDSIF